MKANCGCESGFTRCSKAERLWRQANMIYENMDYDAWINSASLKAYQRHMKRVYEQEHAQIVTAYK